MKSPIRARAIFTSLSAAASLTFAGWAAGVTVDLVPSRDNTLIETPVGNSDGADGGIYVGRVGTNGGGTKRRGLLAFDLSSIPAGSTINAATLSLEMAESPNVTARTITLHRVGANWGEAGSSGGGQGSPAQPGDATWLFSFFNTIAWGTAGGDFDAAPSASQSISGVGPYSWTGAVMVADVQFWLGSPGSNFGWLLLGDETVISTVKAFYSREGPTPPKLTIGYTPPATGIASRPGRQSVWFAPPWPAPASGLVHLGYVLPRTAHVSLSIHDATGRVVRHLSARTEPAGRHTIIWDGRTESGTRVASGVYLATLLVDKDTYQRLIPVVR